MPAPRKFTEAQLHEAALAIVDSEGLPALTMRRLAESLGTGAMTLYNYVEGRDGLEALLVGAVMAEMVPPSKTGDDWSDDVRAIATAMWRRCGAIPTSSPSFSIVSHRRVVDVAGRRGPAGGAGAERTLGLELLAAFAGVGFVTGSAVGGDGLLARTPGGDGAGVARSIAALTRGGRPSGGDRVGRRPGDPQREFRPV